MYIADEKADSSSTVYENKRHTWRILSKRHATFTGALENWYLSLAQLQYHSSWNGECYFHQCTFESHEKVKIQIKCSHD